MDARDLLKTWPCWRNAGAETILQSPAWNLPVRFGKLPGTLTLADLPQDPIVLSVTLDGEARTLALGDSAVYPDLHRLWTKRGGLPSEVLLALVEKECWTVFTLIENTLRQQLALKGLSETLPEGLRGFSVATDEASLSFALDLSSAHVAQLGRLEALDPTHESIRSLTRPCRAVQGTLPLDDAELAALVPGSYVVPPVPLGASRRWLSVEELAETADVLVVSPGETEISFGAIADGTWPEVPLSDEVEILVRGACVAQAASSRVGDVAALVLKA